jgi:hypothetical protein
LNGSDILNDTLLTAITTYRDDWWNTTWDYRCKITINETLGANRTNWLVVINASTLSQNCANIINASENSTRMTDSVGNEILSKLQDWNSTKTGINDTNALIDENDEITFLINLTGNTGSDYYLYYDTNFSEYKDYNNSKLNLYSSEIYVVTGDYDGLIKYFTAYRDGTFSSVTQLDDVCGSDCGGPWGIGIADFDNDGDYDFVTGDDAGNLYVFEKNGSGASFEDKVNVGTYTDSNYIMDVAVADYDNDGNMDFVFSGHEAPYFIAIGLGNNSFNITQFSAGVGGSARSKDAGDFNEDGCMDLLSSVNSLANVYLFKGQCNGSFEDPIIVGGTAEAATNPYTTVAADFDKDGHLDYLTSSRGTGNWDFYKGYGDGTFHLIGDPVFDRGGRHMPGDNWDFNMDGYQDIVFTEYDNEYMYYYSGDGDGTFTSISNVNIVGDRTVGIGTPHPVYELPLVMGYSEEYITSTNSSGNYNFSFGVNLTQGNYSVMVNVSYTGFAGNISSILEVNAKAQAPDTPIPKINSTNGLNSSLEDLNCYATITDQDGDNMNVTVSWYN